MILTDKQKDQLIELVRDLNETLGQPINMDEKDRYGVGQALLYIHDKTPPGFLGLSGCYSFDNGLPVIELFPEELESMEGLVYTCLHEYIHHLQPDSEDAAVWYHPDGTISYPGGVYKRNCLEYDANAMASELFPEFWFKHFN